MEQWEREFHTHRILCGETRLKHLHIILTPPSMEVRLAASEHYIEILNMARLTGVMSESEALDLLREREIWTVEDEAQHTLLTEKIDDLKVGLFENWTHSNNRFLIRQALDKGRDELARLDGLKHSIDHITCEGIAAAAKIRYQIGFSLLYLDRTPIWHSESDMELPDPIIDTVIEYLVSQRLNESEIRDICRNDPWRSYWSARKFVNKGILDANVANLTDEQRHIFMWANLYESIHDSPDCPDDSIIEDDDMLDGWMIKQRRERDAQRARKKGDEIKNDKIRNSDEIFFMADTVEDARKVAKLNDNIAQGIKARRLSHLRNKGQVDEMDMPDTWSRFQQEASKAISERIKGG